MKIRYLLAIPLVGALFLTACKDDDGVTDTIKPVVEELTISNDAHVWADSSFVLSAFFTDNIALSEARIDIHQNFDVHSHQKFYSFFEWEKIISFPGETRSSEFDDTLHVPAGSKAGPYHVEAIVLDLTGNQSDPEIIELIVLRPDQPVIDYDFPSPGDYIEINRGAQYELNLHISDETDLAEVILVLQKHDGHTEPLYEEHHPLDGSNDVLLQQKSYIKVPSGATTGTYELVVSAKDSDGNLSLDEIEVLVK